MKNKMKRKGPFCICNLSFFFLGFFCLDQFFIFYYNRFQQSCRPQSEKDLARDRIGSDWNVICVYYFVCFRFLFACKQQKNQKASERKGNESERNKIKTNDSDSDSQSHGFFPFLRPKHTKMDARRKGRKPWWDQCWKKDE